MPRPSIEDLGRPPQRFWTPLLNGDVDGDFTIESRASCIEEDRLRRRTAAVEIQGPLHGRKIKRSVAALLELLASVSEAPLPPLSAASRVLMRRWRARVCGWLWSLISVVGPGQWVFFTITLPSWWVPSRKLHTVRAKRLIERLRAALYRAGAAQASGWLYAMLHGEFDGSTNGFMLHVHGLATEEMIDVLRALRGQPQFRPCERDSQRYPLVVITRKLKIDQPWGDPLRVISYTSKSYWPQNDSCVNGEGKRRRYGRKRRIVGKHFVRHLAWLHSQPVKDQVLLVHLSIVDRQLIHPHRASRADA